MKKILSILLVFVSLLALFSCGGNGDNNDGNADSQQKAYVYSAKVVAGTTPIVGAKVEIRNESADQKALLTTDSKGEIAKTYNEEIAGEWVAKIISIPDVYGIEKTEYLGKTYTLTNGFVKIEFAQVELPQFEVKVVDQNGDAVVGVRVQVCAGSNCRVAMTDEAGIARFDYAEGEHHANILIAPAGYTDSTNQQEYSFDEDLKCEIAITKN